MKKFCRIFECNDEQVLIRMERNDEGELEMLATIYDGETAFTTLSVQPKSDVDEDALWLEMEKFTDEWISELVVAIKKDRARLYPEEEEAKEGEEK